MPEIVPSVLRLARFALVLPLLLTPLVQSIEEQSSCDDNLMVWREATDSRALCNDYSRAGFFIRRNISSSKWIIFLEGGSLCFSNDTCNRRFFRSEFRTHSEPSLDKPYGTFNPVQLFDSLKNEVPYKDYVNPLMTSMKCLDKSHFNLTRNGTIALEGKDILSTHKRDNADFYEHNHVLIPYCSSDLWLIESEGRNDVMENEDCDIFSDYIPDSGELQFAFRGKVIFQSIFQQLMCDHEMRDASSILLGGSSAGGLGAINLLQWVKEVLPPATELLLLIDSAWFINFQDNIAKTFEENTRSPFSKGLSNKERLVQSLYSHPACNDTTFGYPCCFSSQCMLTLQNGSGNLAYFPDGGVKMFFINSVYDAFLLAPSLLGREDLNVANEKNQTEVLFNFLLLVGEYAGQIRTSFDRTFSLVPSFTYYATQCFQHVYFATSSLWGSPDSVFNSKASIGLTDSLATFRHTIGPGRWNHPLASGMSIREALHIWYTNLNQSEHKRFVDDCDGPYCNEECPETFTLGELTSNNWPTGIKIFLAVIILSIGVMCMFMKLLFKLWLFRLEKKQDDYLESLKFDLERGDSYLAFPACEDADAIAVSCLDLSYSISFKPSKKVKDEKTDKTEALVLNELERKDRHLNRVRRPSRPLIRRSRFVERKNSSFAIPPFSSNLDLQQNGMELESSNVQDSLEPLPEVKTAEEPVQTVCGIQKSIDKKILKNISIYFNPGEMIGIMGPSGCGKTTFMDLLTGRRKTGMMKGDIFINGIPMEEIRDWYVANTGYVLQLARPFYEELTVRDNLILAAEIKLPTSKNFTTKEKFMRVEQVLEVTGLSRLAGTVVGGETGPGLSGGQKRRLVVALQLLRLPSIIFLDEPTSGLDATSSMELLSHLNKLADSNRTVILTIHQPRLEIFHMFHKLVLLSDGKVAYHGAPEKSYEVFVNALTSRYLKHGLIIPSLEDHNPADVIMDMLGNPRIRQVLTEYYQNSEEPKLVRHAINVARLQKYSKSTMDRRGTAIGLALYGARKVGERHANIFVRMAALEARAEKRLSSLQIFFLPMVFLLYGFVLGTVYFQREQGFLVISGMCVFAVASGIFVFPAIEPYFRPAIQLYNYEHLDGVGRSHDLVLQGFIRFITVAFIPVVGSTALCYFLLVNRAAIDAPVFFQVVLVNLCLNYTWTALLIALLVTAPNIAFRISSLIASVAGFTSGFFIPINNIYWWYRWIAYINPNYYGLSSVAFLILEDFNLCTSSRLVCYLDSGAFTLRQFFFDEVNPYLHITILLGFTLFFLTLGIFANWIKHTSAKTRIKRFFNIILSKPSEEILKQMKEDKENFERKLSSEDATLESNEEIGYEEIVSDEDDSSSNISTASVDDLPQDDDTTEKSTNKLGHELTEEDVTPGPSIIQSSVESIAEDPKESKWKKVKQVRVMMRPDNDQLVKRSKSSKRRTVITPFLQDGKFHSVWVPKKRARSISDVVGMLPNHNENEMYENKLTNETEDHVVSPPPPISAANQNKGLPATKGDSLEIRQQKLHSRVLATQAVLKESTGKILEETEETNELPKNVGLFQASKRVTASLKKRKQSKDENGGFSDNVSNYLAMTKSEDAVHSVESIAHDGRNDTWSRTKLLLTQQPKGAIHITKFRDLVKEAQAQEQTSKLSKCNQRPQRHSMGADFYAQSKPRLHPNSLSVDIPTTLDAAHAKQSKMSNLKKKVAGRHLHRQEEIDSQTFTDMFATDLASTSRCNSQSKNSKDEISDVKDQSSLINHHSLSSFSSLHTPFTESCQLSTPTGSELQNESEN